MNYTKLTCLALAFVATIAVASERKNYFEQLLENALPESCKGITQSGLEFHKTRISYVTVLYLDSLPICYPGKEYSSDSERKICAEDDFMRREKIRFPSQRELLETTETDAPAICEAWKASLQKASELYKKHQAQFQNQDSSFVQNR